MTDERGTSPTVTGPLAGIRIIDCSEMIAAAHATSLLSDLGAEVIKVEPVHGDPFRALGQTPDLTDSRGFLAMNRGKRSIALDLKDPRGQEIIHALVRDADVMVLNYRLDTPPKLGVDYETISAINPRIVYVRNTAFGPEGPRAHEPGYDNILQAGTGIMASWGRVEDGLPTYMMLPIADTVTAPVIAWAVTAGLFARDRTGGGQLIDTSLLATSLFLQATQVLNVRRLDDEWRDEVRAGIAEARKRTTSFPELAAEVEELRQREHRFDLSGNIYSRTYRCKDGYVCTGASSPALRAKVQQAVGVTDPRWDPDYRAASPAAHQQLLDDLVAAAEAAFAQWTVEEALARLRDLGVPCGPVSFLEEAVVDPQIAANGLLTDVEHEALGPMEMVGPLFAMSETATGVQGAAPMLGADTDAILDALGYDPTTVDELRRAGVVR